MTTPSALSRFEIGPQVRIQKSDTGLSQVVLSHDSGYSAAVYLHGAHAASWLTPDRQELFFMSRQSNFEPGRPIRGGIPIAFPQFSGQGPLPQHGFVRTREWSLVRSEVAANGDVQVDLQITTDSQTLALWPHTFRLTYRLTLSTSFTLTLDVENTGESLFPFQCALHTYFRVTDIRHASVEGLDLTPFQDFIAPSAEARVATAAPLRIDQETDRVYGNAPDRICLRDPVARRLITIRKQGLHDIVVWNPWIEKARRLADFGDDEYPSMLCLETGAITKPVHLNPGARWTGTTTYTMETIPA